MPTARVVCIALDAADKDLILTWAQDGLLPTFRSLRDRAKWGVVQNPPGLYAGAVWPSFFTGMSPARHGRYCFQQLRSGSYEIERMRAAHLGMEPFWAPLSRARRRVAVIDVPKTHCAPLNGIHITDWGTHDAESVGFQTWPKALAEKIVAQFGPTMLRSCDGEHRSAAQCAALRDTLLARVRVKTAFARDLLAREKWDLVLLSFADAHCVGHQMWHLHDETSPRHDAAIARALGDPLRDVYIALDAAVGELLGTIDSDATVFIMASHGMGRHNELNSVLDEVLRRWEGVGPAAPPSPMLGRIRTAWQMVPPPVRTRLQRVRDRVVERIELRTAAVDGRRKCFAIPNNDIYGGIRVNLVGREPHGRVHPGDEYEAFCRHLRDALHALRDIESDGPAVRAVLRTNELYRGPHLDQLPDLMVEWNRDHPIRGVTSPQTGVILNTAASSRTGDHTAEGLFFAVGPGITPGHITAPVSIMDFAPTFAALLDTPLADADGRSLMALLREARRPQVAAS